MLLHMHCGVFSFWLALVTSFYIKRPLFSLHPPISQGLFTYYALALASEPPKLPIYNTSICQPFCCSHILHACKHTLLYPEVCFPLFSPAKTSFFLLLCSTYSFWACPHLCSSHAWKAQVWEVLALPCHFPPENLPFNDKSEQMAIFRKPNRKAMGQTEVWGSPHSLPCVTSTSASSCCFSWSPRAETALIPPCPFTSNNLALFSQFYTSPYALLPSPVLTSSLQCAIFSSCPLVQILCRVRSKWNPRT